MKRFWDKVDKSAGPDGCWAWTAGKDEHGYGRIAVNGRNARAYRIAYELTRGAIPNGLSVCRHCNNPECVNPAHLFLGTPKNIGRSATRNRSVTGRSLTVRFWEKVDKTPHPDGCWIWTAGRARNGYGLFCINKKVCRAHRVSWELANGPIPDGLCACHTCDNPGCVNPAHLWLGTLSDNCHDRDRKGRTAKGDDHYSRRTPEKVSRGETHPWARLTASKVREIRSLRQNDNTSIHGLARKFGVERTAIKAILSGKSWRYAK